MLNSYLIDAKYLCKKKLSYGPWFYNPYLKQHLVCDSGPMYFYDLDYNLLFKEPALRTAHDVHFIDEDLCLFTFTSSTKLILYNMATRSIVNQFRMRLPKSFGELESIEYAFFNKKKNLILFHGCYYNLTEVVEGILSYDISTKKYTLLYKDNNSFAAGIEYNSKFYFKLYINGKKCFVAFDEDLAYKIIEFDERYEELYKQYQELYKTERGSWTEAFDLEKGVLCCYTPLDAFDGQTYYGGYNSFPGVDLNGKAIIWEPANKVDLPLNNQKLKEKTDSEIDIRKQGLTKDVFENYADEEIINDGYFWALDRIEEKAKAANLKAHEFLGNEQITDEENILYSIGWFETELSEGGIEQYFGNGSKKEFESLIKSLELVGAKETVKVIKKGAKIILGYDSQPNQSEEDYEKLAEKFEDLESELTEDYIGLAVQYLKK